MFVLLSKTMVLHTKRRSISIHRVILNWRFIVAFLVFWNTLSFGAIIILMDERQVAARGFYSWLEQTLFTDYDKETCEECCSYLFQEDNETSRVVTVRERNGTDFRMRTFGDTICPQSFRNLADWIFGWDDTKHKEKLYVSHYRNVGRCLPSGSIIYVSGWSLNEFFLFAYPFIQNPFVLITGASTVTVPLNIYVHLITEPSKIIHWFGQNGGDIPPNARFTHIPLGLNCREHDAAYQQIKNEFKENRASTVSLASNDPLNLFPFPEVKELLLLNFDLKSDKSKMRPELWRRGCSERPFPGSWHSFSKCFPKEAGVLSYLSKLPFIYRHNMHYPFWLSPQGRGIDCHRHWEALLLGRIPVMVSTSIDVLFQDLPVVILPSWNNLTQDLLLQKWDDIAKDRKIGKYRFEKLTFEYWRKIIVAKSRYGQDASLQVELRRCWRPNISDI